MSTSPLIDELQAELGEGWSQISQEERDAIERAAQAAARMSTRLALGEPVSPRTQRHLRAQLANISAITQIHLADTLQSVLEKVLSASIATVRKALTFT